MKTSFFLVSFLGWLGVIARVGIDHIIEKRNGNLSFPWSIFLINILGSFLAGFLYRNLRPQLPEFYSATLLGFLGGFTTFSSYSLRSLTLLQEGDWKRGLSYFVLSPLLGLLFCYLGFVLSINPIQKVSSF